MERKSLLISAQFETGQLYMYGRFNQVRDFPILIKKKRWERREILLVP